MSTGSTVKLTIRLVGDNHERFMGFVSRWAVVGNHHSFEADNVVYVITFISDLTAKSFMEQLKSSGIQFGSSNKEITANKPLRMDKDAPFKRPQATTSYLAKKGQTDPNIFSNTPLSIKRQKDIE